MSYPEDLLKLQNADGGWAYQGGSSCSEPTCLAVLALAADPAGPLSELRRGADWLRGRQRPDGGIAPRDSVQESTWLTVLPLLWPAELAENSIDRKRAVEWVLSQTGRESGWAYRLRLWMLGAKPEVALQNDGWPWYPGAAAWVGPTALSVVALMKLVRQGYPAPGIKERLAHGQAFLLDRRCGDGGWNHGSSKALGYDSDSYPETTGLALLALQGMQRGEVTQGIARAEQHLASSHSQEASSWLRLGLLAHGRKSLAPIGALRGGTMELAVTALAEAAEKGHNVFLQP